MGGENAPKSVYPRIQPFLKNSLFAKRDGQADEETFRKALGVLSEEGNIRQSAEACRLLAELEELRVVGHQAREIQGGDGLPAVIWCNVCTTDEYNSTGLMVGNLAFGCIDVGGNLKLSTVLKQKLRAGEDIETKKCTVLTLAAGVEWASKGKPKRCPSRRRIDVLASGIRLAEFLGVEPALEQTVGVDTDVACEIQSICHSALAADRERDYQAMGMFQMPSIWKYLACEVAAIAIQATMGATFHSYPACHVDYDSLIFLIAHQCPMMWGNPTAATASATWMDWEQMRLTGQEKWPAK